jgi:prepilin-type N-terminal cleavage/methylation domain-containing protein
MIKIKTSHRSVLNPILFLNHARRCAFTLIEIMVVIGIMAIIFAISMPSIYRQMHKDSMRQAVSDVLDACSRARERAILTGVATEVRIRPADRTISVSGSSAPPSTGGNRSYSFEGEAGNEQIVEHHAGTSELFSAKISDRIMFTYIEVNQETDLEQLDEVVVVFFPNGTADEAGFVLRSDNNEARSILVDVITGIASVQESKQGGKL